MVIIDHNHVEQEQEVLKVKPTVAGDVEGDVYIDGIVVVLVLVQVECVYNHNYNYKQAEEKEELSVAEPDEQEDFDTEEGGKQIQIQVQVQVQRIQRVGQSVGMLGCLKSIGHIPSIECLPEPHAMQRYLEDSGP